MAHAMARLFRPVIWMELNLEWSQIKWNSWFERYHQASRLWHEPSVYIFCLFCLIFSIYFILIKLKQNDWLFIFENINIRWLNRKARKFTFIDNISTSSSWRNVIAQQSDADLRITAIFRALISRLTDVLCMVPIDLK